MVTPVGRKRHGRTSNTVHDSGAPAHRASRREVVADTVPITLTSVEFELLVVLARAPGRALSREQLGDNCWRSSAPCSMSSATAWWRAWWPSAGRRRHLTAE
jgi:DNA-binding response OmpR family regulator